MLRESNISKNRFTAVISFQSSRQWHRNDPGMEWKAVRAVHMHQAKSSYGPLVQSPHRISSTSPWSPEEGWCSFLLAVTGFPSVTRSQSLKLLQGDQWKMKQQCLERKPFIFPLLANSVGRVRRTCPVSVFTAKSISGLLTWRCRLAVFAVQGACSDPWCSMRPEIFTSLVFMFFSPRIHRACIHITRGGHVPVGPWKEPHFRCTCSLCQTLLQWRVAHHFCVCCFCLSDGLLVLSLAHLSVGCLLSSGTRQRAATWGALYWIGALHFPDVWA